MNECVYLTHKFSMTVSLPLLTVSQTQKLQLGIGRVVGNLCLSPTVVFMYSTNLTCVFRDR